MKQNSPNETAFKYRLGMVVCEMFLLWSAIIFAPGDIAHFDGVRAWLDSIASQSTQLSEFLPAAAAIRRSSDFMLLLSFVVLFASLSVFAPLHLIALELCPGFANPIQPTKNESP
jgi:hypothetical protein